MIQKSTKTSHSTLLHTLTSEGLGGLSSSNNEIDCPRFAMRESLLKNFKTQNLLLAKIFNYLALAKT